MFVLFCTQYTKLFADDDSDKQTDDNGDTVAVEEFFDLNSALQNEIVAYATVGIKESALLTYKDSFVNHEYSDTAISHHQHHFWIKIPEELVQLKNLKGIVNVVDKEFKDIMKGFAESRSIATLKSLLYQEPRNVQFDDARSSEGGPHRRSVSLSASISLPRYSKYTTLTHPVLLLPSLRHGSTRSFTLSLILTLPSCVTLHLILNVSTVLTMPDRSPPRFQASAHCKRRHAR